MQVIVNSQPNLVTPPPITVCNEIGQPLNMFFLSENINTILGGPIPSGTTVSYYESPTEANADTPTAIPLTDIAYNSTTAANFSNDGDNNVYVRVVSPEGCISVVAQNIILNEQPVIPSITPSFILCVPNGSATLQRNFDLTSKIPELTNGLSDKIVRFYTNEIDAALGGTNGRINTTLYTVNDVSTIYARVENDDDSECFSVIPLNLDVVETPAISPIADFIQCGDIGSGGLSDFDLDIVRTNILANSGVDSVEFYSSIEDAGFLDASRNEIDPTISPVEIPDPIVSSELPSVFRNTVNSSQEIYARIKATTGCILLERFSLIVRDVPGATIVDKNFCLLDPTQPIDISIEPSTDITYLNAVVSPVLLRTSDAVLYYEDAVDRFNERNEISSADLTSQTLGVGQSSKTFYVRLFLASRAGDGSHCYIDAQYNVNVVRVPTVVSSINVEKCEGIPDSQTYTIGLDDLAVIRRNDIYSGTDLNVEIRFYDGASTSSNRLTGIYDRINGSVIFANAVGLVRDGSGAILYECESFDFTTVNLEVIDRPTLFPITDTVFCDTDLNPLDGETLGNLNDLKGQIINETNIDDFEISFFEGATQLTGLNYQIRSGQQYRAEVYNKLDNSCLSDVTFTLNLISGPNIVDTSVPAITVCDSGDDKMESNVDLSVVTTLPPFDNVSSTDFDFEFFRDSMYTLPITITELAAYNLPSLGNHTIYVRLISTNTTVNCSYDTQFQVRLEGLPNLSDPVEISYCSNELLTPDLRENLEDSVVKGLTQLEINNLTLSLHNNPDASDSPIVNGSPLTESELYVRAVDNITFCENIKRVPLKRVLPPSIVTTFNPNECDLDGVDDGQITLDLSKYDRDVFLGDPLELTNHIISYFDDASGSPLVGNVTVTSTTDIRVSIIQKDDPMCESQLVFNVNIQSGPRIFTPPLSLLTMCNDVATPLDNSTLYVDNAALEAALIGTQTGNLELEFIHPTNAIFDITVDNVSSSISYTVLIRNIDTGCETTAPISFNVLNLPKIGALLNNNYCANHVISEVREFWDSQILSEIIPSQRPNFTLTYHTSSPTDVSNLLAESDPIPNTGTITVRLENSEGCFSEADFSTVMQNLPTIDLPVNRSHNTCDGDGVADGITDFDFSSLNASFLGTQPLSDFRVTYHLSQDNADNRVVVDSRNITTGDYFVRIENVNTRCYNIEEFRLNVDLLPIIDDSDIGICKGELSQIINKQILGFSNLEYLWEFRDINNNRTRSDVSDFAIELTPNDIGDFVTLTVRDVVTNCESSKRFEIKEYITPVLEASIEIINHFGDGVATVNVQEGGNNFTYELLQGSPVVTEPQKSNVFRNLLPGDYTVRINDENGCGPVEHKFTFVDYQPYFSPNDDGVADTWNVASLGSNYPGAVVYIHDRFGKLLATLTGDATWDGTYGGTPVPSDDYWILIEFTDRPSINDHITLKR